MEQSHPLSISLSAARRAGDIIREMRASGFECSKKGARDLLTSADLAAEKEIVAQIRQVFPDHYVLSEEASPETTIDILKKDHVWIIDPIDGTTNFAHGHFQVGISIAYAQKGKIQTGVVYAPFVDELFHAERGTGAFLNNSPISVSQTDTLGDALIATGFPYKRDDIGVIITRLAAVIEQCRDIRRCGAASLDVCWTACGRIDGYYENVQVWDIAAAALIARESGAQVGTSGGIPNSWIDVAELFPDQFLVANPILFELLRKILQ